MGANGTTRAAGRDTLSRQTSTLGSSRLSLLGGVLLHDNSLSLPLDPASLLHFKTLFSNVRKRC